MKIPFTQLSVEVVPEGNKIFGFSTAKVQYFFGSMAVIWTAMPEQYQNALLSAIGLTPDRMLLASALLWVFSTLTARRTKVVRNEPEIDSTTEGMDK